MSIIFQYASNFLIIAGCIVCLIASLGVYRFNNSLYQLHASTKGLFFGTFCIITGAIILDLNLATKFRLALIALFFSLTIPLSSYAIGRAWHKGYMKSKFRNIHHD